MDIQQAFLSDIASCPHDNGPRLIFADWLEENGDPQRAEFIRMQCEHARAEGAVGPLHRLPGWTESSAQVPSREQDFLRRLRAAEDGCSLARSQEHTAREDALLAAHRSRWLQGLSCPVDFRRGFPEVIEIGAAEYLQAAALLERISPAQAIRLTSFASASGKEKDELNWDQEYEEGVRCADLLAQCPQLERWIDLEILVCPGRDIFTALMESPHLTRLRRFVAVGNETGSGVHIIVDARFNNLRWLDLYDSNSAGGRPGDDVFIDIVTSPHLAQLEFLRFGGNEVTDYGVAALAASPTMGRLRSLFLVSSYLTGESLRALGHSSTLANLRHLDVSWSLEDTLEDSALATLLESPLFGRLTLLDIHSNPISNEGIGRLAHTPQSAGLRTLVLGGLRLREGGWERTLATAIVPLLAESPYLTGLRRLELPNVPIDDDAAALLARSISLCELRELSAQESLLLTDVGRLTLQARFGDGLHLHKD